MNIKIIAPLLAAVALSGCDEGFEPADLESADLEMADLEMDADATYVEVEEEADLWDGLTADEIALLEDEDGADNSEDFLADAPTDLTAALDANEAVPACVYSNWIDNGWRGSWGYVGNACTYSVRVRMIWRWAPDTPCVDLQPGHIFRTWRPTARPMLIRVDAC